MEVQETEEDPQEGPSTGPKKSKKRVHIMDQDPMFPRRLRKSPPPLMDLAESTVRFWLLAYLRSRKGDLFDRTVHLVREHLDRQLLPALQTRLLSGLVPAEDTWRYSCLEASRVGKLRCRAHRECRLVYRYCDRIVRLLVSHRTEKFQVDLRRVRVHCYPRLASELSRATARAPMAALRVLRVTGGTVHSDHAFFRDMESMCRDLLDSAPALEELHLPICSNHALRSISDMPKLHSFRADRTRYFNRRGLWHLCHPSSKTRHGLQELHFGVFKHHLFNKLDACKFFTCMRALKSFSLMDENRRLINVGDQYPSHTGDKVLAYSVLRLAIVDAEQNQAACPACLRESCRRLRQDRIGGDGEALTNPDEEPEGEAESQGGHDDNAYKCQMTEIKVVDRRLKPAYLLQSCPDLTGLYLDWQEELSLPPFCRFEQDWFSRMLRTPDWVRLCSQLRDLEVVFPSAYSHHTYSLSLGDLGRLLGGAASLRRLKLVGAGRESPVPLIHILQYCPNLVELHLERTSVHVPDNYEVISRPNVNHNVRVFRFLGDMTSLLMNEFMTKGVSHYMPGLKELELQPESPVGYSGMSPAQMHELTRLQHLERLSLPLSVRECEMNMPEVVYVLRDMACLRFLVLSWGRWCNAYDINDNKVAHMMRWLFEALGAENANIHLQLSYNMHPGLFSRRGK